MKIRTPYWLIIGSLVGAAGVSHLSTRLNRGVHTRTEVTHMKVRTPYWLIIGSLVGAALLVALVVAGSSRPTRAAEPPAPKADEFSQYVTKEGGISLPADYREKFVHLGT